MRHLRGYHGQSSINIASMHSVPASRDEPGGHVINSPPRVPPSTSPSHSCLAAVVTLE